MPTYNRPTLPPLHYVLFLPSRRAYVWNLDMERGRFRMTIERSQACALPEPEAVEVGNRMIRALGEPVELRSPTQ